MFKYFFAILFILLPVVSFAGFTDYEENPVLEYDKSGFDAYRVMDPKVIKVGDEYKMYYTGLGSSNKKQIGLATSNNGIDWVRFSNDPVFKCGENTLSECVSNINWSSYRVSVVDVIYEDGVYKMWYLGDSYNYNPPNYLGFATSSDGIVWSAYDNNPVFPNYNSSRIEFLGVINFGGEYILYYRLNDGLGVYAAKSEDGINWDNVAGGSPISSRNFVSFGLYDDVVIAFERGAPFYSRDGINFKDTGLGKIVPEEYPNLIGSFIVDDNSILFWYEIILGRFFGGVTNTGINYMYGPKEDFDPLLINPIAISSNLQQHRVDGETVLPDGGHFVGNSVVLRGEVEEANTPLALEVEVKKMGEEFDETNTVISEFSDESELSVVVSDLIDHADLYDGNNEADFKWQARVIEEEGNASDWVEFGDDETDFSIKAVPLVTQVESPYPNSTDTSDWANDVYASGNSKCGQTNTIMGCGCAISSLTTIGRYYGLETGLDGSEVNPGNLNAWMKSNKGFDKNDNVNWTSAIKFFGKKEGDETKQFLSITDYLYEKSQIDTALAGGPVVAKGRPAGYTHYFVADSVVGSGYEISDPFWFNTHFTNETRDYATDVQDYNNSIIAVKDIDFSSEPKLTNKSLEVHLGSPAEFVITDNEGNKYGIDPRTNTEYDDIETGAYWHETNFNPGLEGGDQVHEIKYGWVLDAEHSPYTIEVIGTDTGDYDLSVLVTEEGGESRQLEFASTTSSGEVHTYYIKFASDWTENELLLQKFINWLKSNTGKLPGGFVPFVPNSIRDIETKLTSINMVLDEKVVKLLDSWDRQNNLDKGWNFVQGVLKTLTE